MPTAKREGAEIAYEVRGRGPPLVLLEGLGYGRWMWQYQVPDMSTRFRLLMVDNRGIGTSTPLTAPYTVEAFARDALAVLDAEGVEQAHLLGVSMGGFIAQSVAALAPKRCGHLVLVSTSPGGPRSLPMPQATWNELIRAVPGESAREHLRRTMALAFTEAFPRNRSAEFEALLDVRLTQPQLPEQWMFQASSSRQFDATASDRRLDAPTLVVAGTEDRVLPWTNALLLYKAIPRAALLLFRRLNHLVFIEGAADFNAAVVDFLTSAPQALPEATVREVG